LIDNPDLENFTMENYLELSKTLLDQGDISASDLLVSAGIKSFLIKAIANLGED